MNQPKPYIATLNPYQPGLTAEHVAREYGLAPEDVIKLASNENPLGMGPAAQQAIEAALAGAYRYPEQHDLLQALAKHHKLKPSQIIVGNGTDDILGLIARTYLGPGDEAIASQYAFAMFGIAVQTTGATNVVVPAKDYGHDLAAIRAAITSHTKVIYLVNPNNPTGTFLPYDDIQQFIEQVPPEIIIVLDEAYYEYLRVGDQANTPQWLQDYPNLILTRTFSKVHGLAGMRVGYGLACTALIGAVSRVRQPFNVNILGLAAATAALQDHAFVVRSYNANALQRDYLLDKLETLKTETLPAYGNFISIRVKDAAAVNQALLQKGIIVRPLAGYGMPDWLRVTIGLPDQNQRFIQALTDILPS